MLLNIYIFSKVCDKKLDCEDGTDETQCMDTIENVDHDACDNGFICDSGMTCLGWESKCDGHLDCVDGSDEDMCIHWEDDKIISQLMDNLKAKTHDQLGQKCKQDFCERKGLLKLKA